MTDKQFEEQWKLFGELRLAEDEEYKALKNNTFVYRWYDTVALVAFFIISDYVSTRLIQLKELASLIVQIIILAILCTLYYGIRMYFRHSPNREEIEARVKREYREELERKG